MRRFGQVIELKPEGAEAYIKLHAEVWPEVLAMITECHISNYSIYCKNNLLFAYFEYTGSEFDKDMAHMAADATTQRWWDTVKPLMAPIADREPDEFWANMDEIFHLD